MNGEPWFVLKDVCGVLGLGTVSKVADRLEADEKGMNQIHTPRRDAGCNGHQRIQPIQRHPAHLRGSVLNTAPFRIHE